MAALAKGLGGAGISALKTGWTGDDDAVKEEIALQLQNITQAIEDEADARENADTELGNSIPQITALTNDEIDQAIAEAEAEMQTASLQTMEAESGD